jgi:thymidylate kinase
MSALAPLIAVIGCDGSGKSTLAEALVANYAARQPVSYVYLGLKSGAMGEAIKQWPVIGPWLERKLTKRASQARDTEKKIPGTLTALVIYLLSTVRMRRFRRTLALRKAGRLVITDRYPQVEVPGFYDGPGLSAAQPDSPFVAWLAKRERAKYVKMAAFVPTLVIRISIDIETALARKPDHARDLLEKKIAVTPVLTFGGAPIIELDGREPFATVKAKAVAAIDAALATHPLTFAA